MPKYLGIDFLSQALRQKDQLLSRMLISCPGYGEDETIILISGKTERNFPWYLVKAQFEKVPKNDALSYLLEILPSRFGRKPERLHSTARVIEYVPSSNPDSPPPSFLSDSHFDLEEEIVRDVCDYLSRHEVDFSKYDLPYSSNTEEWQLEEMVMKDCFEEFLRRIPRFQDLALRLKPRKVTDPFVGKDGCLRSEYRTICSRFYCDRNLTNISIVGIQSKESFVKLSISEQTETEHYTFASPLIGSAYSSHDTYVEINYKKLSPIPEQSSEVILERNRYFKEIQSSCKTVTWTKHQEYENYLKYHVKPKVKSFLEINQTEINIAVKNVSSLVLESPPPSHRTEHKENVDLNTQNIDHLEPCQLQLGESVCVFSPRSQKKITQEVVASSRLPDKISSLMLVVPDVHDSDLVRQDFTRTLSTLSKDTKEDFQSELELQLHWDPLHTTPEKNVNQLRFITECKECSAPESPLEVPTFASELKLKLKKMPWGNVYVSGTDASPLALELTKPSPLVSCMAEKENISETNTSIPNSTRSKSSGKVIVGNAETCSSIRTSKVDSKKYNSIHSGIDDFVLLRTGMKSSSRCPPKAIVKAMKVDQRNGDQNDDILTKTEDLKDHAEVVDASLAGELQTAYNYIENYIRPCLLQLQEAGCVASSYTTSNLTADYTRFVLKQEEKKKSDIFSTDQTCDVKRHKMLICLHVFVTTAELIRECGITVAQDYIRTMSTQYNKELDGALDQIKDYLMKTEQSLNNAKTSHPKVVATYNYVRTWQPQPSSLTLDNKILVMIFRGFQDVSTSLASQLQQLKGLKITTIERKSQIYPSISNTHVVICDPANIPDNFPWSSFALIIAYEDKIEWLNKVLFGKSLKENNFICLKGVSSGDQHCQQEFAESNIENLPAADPETPKQEVYTLIGSSKITKNANLLRCLEQRCGIVIIEREYEKILKNAVTTSSKMCRQPDLILDQRASVIIENVINFSNEEGYKNIVDLVLSTSFKCQICSIILVCENNSNSEYSFLGDVQSNLAKFHGCLMSIQQSFPHFVVDIFYSRSVNHTASLIRRFSEITRDSSHVFTKQDWVRRNWLTEECSENERFLLGFPSLNSFSAQLMLNVLPLTTLVTAPFESLKKALPWIPGSILKNFKETAECGLHVEEDENHPIQIPQFPSNGDIVEAPEYNDYHFNPVIENTEEDVHNEFCTFPRSEIPSDYFNTYVVSSQQLDNDIFIPPTSSFGSVVQKETRENLPHQEPISENYFGNADTFTEIHLDDSSTYEKLYHREKQRRVRSPVRREKQRRVRSPVRSTFEDVAGDISVTVDKYRNTMLNGAHREKSKLLLRPPKNLKRGYEMADVVGVVQPKPRNIPVPDLRLKSASYLSQPPASQIHGHGPRHADTVLPNYQCPKQLRTEFLYHSMYENPQKKKTKLTFEIVPGAKNGQTRLTFV